MNARFVARVRAVTFLCLAVALVIIGRLYLLQILQGKLYAARADAQFTLPQTPLMQRDSIYFTDKSGTLLNAATLRTGFSLALNPTKITDIEKTYQALNALVPLSHDEFVAKASKTGTQYSLIASHLDSAVGLRLEALALPGVILAEDAWRYYPGGSLAAQELGFVAYNGNAEEGRYGLERYYEQTLVPRGGDLYSNFACGRAANGRHCYHH
jgi:cell division protein FtsI/penicillin-binding protein 2